jgi:hypothetical protein
MAAVLRYSSTTPNNLLPYSIKAPLGARYRLVMPRSLQNPKIAILNASTKMALLAAMW